MDGAGVPPSGSAPASLNLETYGAEGLAVPELMAVLQHLFLNSSFSLIEEILRNREHTLRGMVASSFRQEFSKKDAENAVLKAKCRKACMELTTVIGVLKKLREMHNNMLKIYHTECDKTAEYKRLNEELEADRRTWLEKQEIYLKKIAELEHEYNSYERLQAEQWSWLEKEQTYNRRIAELECELSGSLNRLEAASHNFEADRRTWQEKEETYNRRITKLENQMKSEALGLEEAESNMYLQVKEAMEAIHQLKHSEEVIMNLRKESEQFCDLKLKHEQLIEKLIERKKKEEAYEERISKLEKELKERDKATAKYHEVTSAYMELEDKKDAAESEAMEWRRKCGELESRVNRIAVPTEDQVMEISDSDCEK